MCVCVWVCFVWACVRARVRVCVCVCARAHVRACVRVYIYMSKFIVNVRTTINVKTARFRVNTADAFTSLVAQTCTVDKKHGSRPCGYATHPRVYTKWRNKVEEDVKEDWMDQMSVCAYVHAWVIMCVYKGNCSTQTTFRRSWTAGNSSLHRL